VGKFIKKLLTLLFYYCIFFVGDKKMNITIFYNILIILGFINIPLIMILIYKIENYFNGRIKNGK